MSEPDQLQNDSPLVSERGVTTISGGVVSQIAGMAAQEVEGVHMGGSVSRTAGGLLGSFTGSESQTRGVSVEVGRLETAIDLKMGVEYGRNILQSVDDVRRRIIDRVQNMTGLQVTELNVTIADITFPEKKQVSRLGPGGDTSTQSLEPADDTDAGPETRPIPSSEPDATVRETAETDPGNETVAESESEPVPEEAPVEEAPTEEVRAEEAPAEEAPAEEAPVEEAPVEEAPTQEVRVEDRPPEGDETAELRPEDTALEQRPEQRPQGEETETGAETRTDEETAEARRRRRAEERARRRRGSEGSDEG